MLISEALCCAGVSPLAPGRAVKSPAERKNYKEFHLFSRVLKTVGICVAGLQGDFIV